MPRCGGSFGRVVLRRRSALSLAAAVALGGRWARAAPAGQSLTHEQTARLLTIGGPVTEIVYALGMGSHIVAVDTTSLYPPEALAEKRSVGYLRALSPEGVLSVDPTAILLLDRAGPPEVVDILSRSAVPCVMVDGTPSAEAVAGRVSLLARTLGVADAGRVLVARIEAGFARLAGERAAARAGIRVLFVLSISNGRPLAGGRDTAADSILALAGATNVAAGFSGYKPMSDEAVIEAAPDVVLTMSGTTASHAVDVLDLPAFRGTQAGRHGRVVAMDGESLLGFGPRTPETASELIRRLAAAGGP